MQSAQLSCGDDSEGIKVVRGRAVQLDRRRRPVSPVRGGGRVEGSRRPIRRTMQGP